MNAVLVIVAALLLDPSARVREPSWPMAVEGADARTSPRTAREAPPRVLQRAVPEDRSVTPPPTRTPRTRIIEAPVMGWPGASVDPGPRI